jgi:hypothetical protein
MKEILDNYGLYICIGLGVLIVIVIIILIITSKKNKPEEEDTSSILDVNIEGVVDKDFKYGYKKEDTVVLKPEEVKKVEEEIKSESKENEKNS